MTYLVQSVSSAFTDVRQIPERLWHDVLRTGSVRSAIRSYHELLIWHTGDNGHSWSGHQRIVDADDESVHYAVVLDVTYRRSGFAATYRLVKR